MSDMDALTDAYRAFNARDMEAAIAIMAPDVDWHNGVDDSRVHGLDTLRDYWTRQWSLTDPRVEPIEFASDDGGRIRVTVRQTVHDLSRALLVDKTVEHVFSMRDGLITRMDIFSP